MPYRVVILTMKSNQVTTVDKVVMDVCSDTEEDLFFRETQLRVMTLQEKEGLSALASVPAVVPHYVKLLLN